MTAILEIDLGALVANWWMLAARHDGETAAVVKANAYGLGTRPVVQALRGAGCKHFFVAHLSEALAVREVAPDAMIAVLNGILPGEEDMFARHDILPVLGSLAEIALWRQQAARLSVTPGCMLHADTGMNRLGLSEADLAVLRAEPGLLTGLRIEYVMSHLAASEDRGAASNARQAARFREIMRQFPGVKTSFANSSGVWLGPQFGSDLSRPGAAIYGVNPSPGTPNIMRDVVKLRAPILAIRAVPAGESVGYNACWTAARASRIATVGVGYADGYLRSLTNKAIAYFDGVAVPLVGRVSMDLTTFDVTDIPVRAGDVLSLIGPGHGVDALAALAGTNGYEILTSLGARYRRIYTGA